jgi:hypothetical protein
MSRELQESETDQIARFQADDSQQRQHPERIND